MLDWLYNEVVCHQVVQEPVPSMMAVMTSLSICQSSLQYGVTIEHNAMCDYVC